MSKKLKIGNKVTIPAGAIVKSFRGKNKRQKDSVVTIREITTKLSGVVMISWKSHGVKATATYKK